MTSLVQPLGFNPTPEEWQAWMEYMSTWTGNIDSITNNLPFSGGGGTTFVQTPTEADAGVTPVNTAYPPGFAYRYGVDPTGVTETSGALQNWINAAWAMYNFTDGQGLWNGGGGAIPVLTLPPGKYRLNNTLFLPSGITFRSMGYPSRTTNHTRLIMDSTGLTPGRTWTANSFIPSGGRTVPSPARSNGFYFTTGGGGITGAVEPNWPTVIGNTVNDGSVTWTCAALNTAGDNRNKPILKFSRNSQPRTPTSNPGVQVNSAVTTTIQGIEFWYVVYSATFSNPLNGAGIAVGDYPQGGSLNFDVDAADFMVIDCVFQHTPAAMRCDGINLTNSPRGDGQNGARGIGIFFEECEFDAAAVHIYSTNCFHNMFFRNCLFFGVLSGAYSGCTGKVVYDNCWFEGGAYIDGTGEQIQGPLTLNNFASFSVKNCNVESPGFQWFVRMNSSRVVDFSGNTFDTAAVTGAFYVTGSTSGSISNNVFDNIGQNASPGTGPADFPCVVKLINCQNVKVCDNNITASQGGIYNGFGILTSTLSGGTSTGNFVSGNCVTAPFNGATFNGQDRFINLNAGDIQGVNFDFHDGGTTDRLGATIMRGQLGLLRSPQNISAGGNITIDASLGNLFSLFVTTTSAITIQVPINGVDGQRISIWLANASGSTLSASFASGYKMAAWTNPLNGNNRTVDFINWNGTWYEAGRTTADVPN